MKRRAFFLFVVAVGAWLGGGCKTETGALPAQKTPEFNLERTAEFVALDRGVQRSITYSNLRATTLPDGRLEVTAHIRNRENRRLQVQVNCVFKDEQYVPVDETPFQTLILTENSMEGVRFTSMNSQAKKYTVRVREAR
jgi:hypothetical protein